MNWHKRLNNSSNDLSHSLPHHRLHPRALGSLALSPAQLARLSVRGIGGCFGMASSSWRVALSPVGLTVNTYPCTGVKLGRTIEVFCDQKGRVIAQTENGTKTFPVDETTLVFAFRYALGRQTAAPSIMVTELKRHWSNLQTWTRNQIQCDIRQAISGGAAGAECDVQTWNEVLSWQSEPSFLWRDDGERFTRGVDGGYTMDSSQMGSPYTYTYEVLMSHRGAFSEHPPRK